MEIDLTNSEVIDAFCQCINERKLALGLTNQSIADKIGMDVRQVQRYMSKNIKEIPERAYRDFLHVLQISHKEFKQFYKETTKIEQRDRSINISGSTLHQSPIGNEGNITYNLTNLPGEL